MAAYLENYGLDFFQEDEETLMGFLGYLVQTGKPITGYYNSPYFFKSMGNVEFWVDTEIDAENKNLCVKGFDAHCGGNCVWELICSGIDIEKKERALLKRTIMFQGSADRGGMLPVHVITADVLPSFLEGDKIKLQVIAQPLTINYFSDEDAYFDGLPKDENGKTWGIADGSLFPLSFLNNHDPERYEKGKDYESDSYLHFHATVTKLYHGVFDMEGKRDNMFIRCFAQTAYGELEFDHTFEQVPEEQRGNMKVGAVISGVCILSGDAAIDEYENGIIRDTEHNLKLLRYTFVKGEAERLRSVLSSTAVYEDETTKDSFSGPEEIIGMFNYVHENSKKETFARLATITEADGLEFPVGTRCVILAEDEEDNYISIVFTRLDEEGRISGIKVCTDSRYKFRVDSPPSVESPLDDVVPPDSVAEPIFMRAKLHGMIDDDLELENVLTDTADRVFLERNAENMLNALQETPQPDVEIAFENVFGYLFAKAMEHTIIAKRFPGEAEIHRGPVVPQEAFAEIISTSFSEEEQKKLENNMKMGKQFYKDLKYYVISQDISEDEFPAVFKEAAVLVQRIGQIGAERMMQDAPVSD